LRYVHAPAKTATEYQLRAHRNERGKARTLAGHQAALLLGSSSYGSGLKWYSEVQERLLAAFRINHPVVRPPATATFANAHQDAKRHEGLKVWHPKAGNPHASPIENPRASHILRRPKLVRQFDAGRDGS
jgi:hypothetical protein